MEKKHIGINAGRVWHILNENGKLSIFELCRRLSLTFEEVSLAIGWLARERKISVDKVENMLIISLYL